ncbi:lysophospholipid acyltransferase family protein [Luteolibacter flavescens]|uniref:Lysophospholipid acyltransferase family protein n=1 Tax=Luteolibacter flavescens TaxID=1859460 RepID=A0ABT3FVJ6_9BACT|nr:lysophospholipid acyltransferase family protein [Luteolibacter flavescens]MCW1887623.1 lysophospholipid acyltransferase family protein [Luteolibacter flavescens]
MAGKGSEIRESGKATALGTFAGRLMQAWSATLRFEIIDRCGLTRPGGIPGPVIYCLWHNRIFTMPAAWKKSCGKHRQAVVLTSASHDGAALARAVGVFGIGSVRGSSSRRGVAALVGMRKALREDTDVCVTPDGPRGPKHIVQPGIIKLAESTGVPIVPIHVTYSSCRELKTWDRFAIPAPGSRVRVIFDEVLAVPGGLSEDDFETWRRRLEEIMLRGANPTSDHLR